MKDSYKTLILLDNSLSVKEGSRDIIKATLHYLFDNAGEETSFAAAVFGEKISYLEEYGAKRTQLKKAVENVEFINQNTYVPDALMTILEEWRQADFACRNILLISDGLSETSNRFSDEELYYALEQAGYPVYVIGCVQNNNESAMKQLSAIARISKGELFLTEFEDSEAEVERKIGDALLAAMNEKYESEMITQEVPINEMLSDSYSGVVQGKEAVLEKENDNEINNVNEKEQETVIYELKQPLEKSITEYVVFSAGILLCLFLFLFAGYAVLKKNRKHMKQNREFMDGVRRQAEKRNSCNMENNNRTEDREDCYGVTQALYGNENEISNATRLLFAQNEVFDIYLEDRSDPTKVYRTSCSGHTVLGRSENSCDFVIEHDDSISGRHCELYRREEQWFVRDLHSSNGTKVNGQKVYQELEIHAGDILRLGQAEFLLSI